MNQQHSGEPPLAASTFEQELGQVETALQDLKTRYGQVQRDQAEQARLLQARDRLQHSNQPNLKAELQRVNDRLEELAVSLESQLFSWGSLREVFWQILRFGGLGMVIGWGLALAFLQAPRPEPSTNGLEPVPQRSTSDLTD